MSEILISGASVAGPALAYWLRRYGFDPTVVERAPAPRNGGFAIDLRGAAREVAERMGIMADLRRASLLMLRPRLLAGAVLLRAMVPFEPESSPDLSGKPVYLAAGRSDPIIPPENTDRLAGLLRAAGAEVTLDWQPGGHGIGPVEVAAAKRWLGDKAAAREAR